MGAVTLPADAPKHARDELQARQCGHKTSYLCQTHAQNAVILHELAGIPDLQPYQCGFCGDWHVGHKPGNGVRPPRRSYRPRQLFGAQEAPRR